MDLCKTTCQLWEINFHLVDLLYPPSQEDEETPVETTEHPTFAAWKVTAFPTLIKLNAWKLNMKHLEKEIGFLEVIIFQGFHVKFSRSILVLALKNRNSIGASVISVPRILGIPNAVLPTLGLSTQFTAGMNLETSKWTSSSPIKNNRVKNKTWDSNHFVTL